VLTYYADGDCDGELDDDDGNGRLDALGSTVMVSMDGPLPPIANVSLGERVVVDGELVAVTADDYAELTDAFGYPIDSDRDGLVDVTTYSRREGAVTKRHFEIDPDDLGPRPAFLASAPLAGLALASAAPVDASVASIAIASDWLPGGIVARTRETLVVSGRSHAIAAEVAHGLPLEVEPVSDGFVFHFVPLRRSGSIALRIDEPTRSTLGWTGLPTVSMDGHHLTGTSRDVDGTVIVQAGFSAAHSIALEVRFSKQP
jgi:hypothetical protein